MRKTIATVVAASFLGAGALALAPTPAAAFAPLFFAPLLASKEDKNFKAVNPYAPKKVSKSMKKKKKM